MRVIAGEFRGRLLLPPATDATRPVTDRVKQSLFDVIAPLLPDARVYDCFAGTGSMGLEALSRGASHATFFEADRSAAKLLRRNVDALAVASRSVIVTDDLFRWFAGIVNSGGREPTTDLIFLDPPYRFVRERPDALVGLAQLFALRHLKPTGTLVFRHDAADSPTLPAMTRYDVREYGGMVVQLFHPAATEVGHAATEA